MPHRKKPARLLTLLELIDQTPSPVHQAATERNSAGVMEVTGRRRRKRIRKQDRMDERRVNLGETDE